MSLTPFSFEIIFWSRHDFNTAQKFKDFVRASCSTTVENREKAWFLRKLKTFIIYGRSDVPKKHGRTLYYLTIFNNILKKSDLESFVLSQDYPSVKILLKDINYEKRVRSIFCGLNLGKNIYVGRLRDQQEGEDANIDPYSTVFFARMQTKWHRCFPQRSRRFTSGVNSSIQHVKG